MVLLSIYATIYSSNGAGQSTPIPAKHGLFPTTNRVSRKHPLLSNNRASLSDSSLPFTHASLLVTFLAQYPGILSAKPTPTAATSRLFWKLETGNWKPHFVFHSSLLTFSLEPTHLSNTALHPIMETTRGIWSAAAGVGDFGEFATDFHYHHFHRIHRLRRQPNRTTTTTPTTSFFGFYSALSFLSPKSCVLSPFLGTCTSG
jgi:hypothetical protein